jgi:GNAT superfamily N-acetyltransferase
MTTTTPQPPTVENPYLPHLPRVVRLESARVRVRSVHHGDGPRLQALLARMSPRTRRLRFHSPIAQLTASQLRSLVEADHHDHETLLAEVELDGRWHLAGFAQYHRLRGGGHADSAIVLEDAWQGRGIGRVLARCLAEAAGRAGIVALTGEVLSENRGALGFIRELAPRLERRLHGTTTELVCWLSHPDAIPAPALAAKSGTHTGRAGHSDRSAGAGPCTQSARG